jgi:hypothetical protein
LAGIALLPWEKWFAWLIHKVAVALRRRLYRMQQKRRLARSEGWPRAHGVVEGVNWDSSNPREEVVFSYSTQRGCYSGSFWHWFDSSDARHVEAGDRVVLRFNPANDEESVFLEFC